MIIGIEYGKRETERDGTKTFPETGRFGVIAWRQVAKILTPINSAQLDIELEFSSSKRLKDGTRVRIKTPELRDRFYVIELARKSLTGATKYLCSEAP